MSVESDFTGQAPDGDAAGACRGDAGPVWCPEMESEVVDPGGRDEGAGCRFDPDDEAWRVDGVGDVGWRVEAGDGGWRKEAGDVGVRSVSARDGGRGTPAGETSGF